jgi:hypothetical protein
MVLWVGLALTVALPVAEW